MGKIDDLIKELCPDGVKYVKLGEVSDIKRGIRVIKKDLSVSGLYPVFQNSLIPLGYYDKTNCSANTTFIIMAGAAGEIGYTDKPVWAADDCFYIDSKENLHNKYIYYFLLKRQHYLKSKVRKASIPRLSREFVEKLQIPLPPLSIQQQIVEILDNFTDSISNLQEELELREKQMEYYREKLFDFNEDEYEWKYIPEVASYSTGLTYKPTNISDSGILVLRSSNIKDNTLSYDDNVFVQMGIPNRSKIHKNDILICVRNGSKKLVGKCAYISELKYECAFGAFMNILRAHSIDSKFLYYSWLLNSTINQYKGDDAAPICQITNKDFNRIKIPVPSLTRQQEIVDILDTFESMITNIKEEIELRQKQYEYYREKLLTFERKEA